MCILLQLQHTDIRASQYSTNSDDSVKSDNPTEVTTTSNRSEEVSDNVTVKMESFATGLTEVYTYVEELLVIISLQ